MDIIFTSVFAHFLSVLVFSAINIYLNYRYFLILRTEYYKTKIRLDKLTDKINNNYLNFLNNFSFKENDTKSQT